MSFASLVGSIVHLPMKGRTVSDFTQTIVNYPHRGEYCVKSTQIKAWISISKSVWMLVGVHNVHLCCLPVSTHFVSFTDHDVNSLLFVTNVTNLQTPSQCKSLRQSTRNQELNIHLRIDQSKTWGKNWMQWNCVWEFITYFSHSYLQREELNTQKVLP